MDNPVEVCFCTSSRSERSLVEPLLKKLEANPRYNLHILKLPTDTTQAMNWTWQLLHGKRHIHSDWYIDFAGKKFDLAFCPFDRPEMLGAAMVFFRNHIPIAQIHAGDRSLFGTYDDIIRHQITLFSSIQFCTGIQSYFRTLGLLAAVEKSADQCREIGYIQFDDIEIDYSKVPDMPFDLVVYNPPTRRPDCIPFELDDIEDILVRPTVRPTIWIEPNEDHGRDLILARMKTLEDKGRIKTYDTLPRAQFLGLIEKSKHCIGNSSSFFIERPYLAHKSHIHIGVRNQGREVPRDAEPGGTDRIIKHLDEWF